MGISNEKAKEIYEMAKEKNAYSKVCEDESSDDEMQMNPTMKAVVNTFRNRLADQIQAQLLAKLAKSGLESASVP